MPSLSGFEEKRIAGVTKSATSGSSGKLVSVEIGWRQNPEYFMSSKDVKTGVAIFNKADDTEVASFMPTPESEPDGSSYYYSWNWNNGDLVYLHLGGEDADDCSASYSFYDIENKMNIDFYDIWEDRFEGLFCFDRSVFPIFSSKHLLKSSSENHSYTYDIDDNGDVTGMTVYAGGEKYHVSIDYY